MKVWRMLIAYIRNLHFDAAGIFCISVLLLTAEKQGGAEFRFGYFGPVQDLPEPCDCLDKHLGDLSLTPGLCAPTSCMNVISELDVSPAIQADELR